MAVLVSGIIEVPVVIDRLGRDAALPLALGEDICAWADFHVSLFLVKLQRGAVCHAVWHALAAL